MPDLTTAERVERMPVGAHVAILSSGSGADYVYAARVKRLTKTRVVVQRADRASTNDDWFPKDTLTRRYGGYYHSTLHLPDEGVITRAVARATARRYEVANRALASVGIRLADVRRVIEAHLNPDRGVHEHHANLGDREAAQRIAQAVGRVGAPVGE